MSEHNRYRVTFEWTDEDANVQWSEHEVLANSEEIAIKAAAGLEASPDDYDSVDVEEVRG